MAELKELKANPNKPGPGTCLEAILSEGEGVQAPCSCRTARSAAATSSCAAPPTAASAPCTTTSAGRSRRPGRACRCASPASTRCPTPTTRSSRRRTWPTAREIAEKRRAAACTRPPTSARRRSRWRRSTSAKIAELKVILKADFRGSIEAIRKELEKLQHEEVRVRVLHAGIGGITESDVQLALTSPEDTLIVGFNVVPDDGARRWPRSAASRSAQYDIIYKLTDDIRAALEGKLKPREEIVHLGRAVVRETFKISRVGTIAGCYVTQGVIERSAKIRVIRERRGHLPAAGPDGRPGVAQALQGRRPRGPRGLRVRHQGRRLRRHQGRRRHRGVPHRAGAADAVKLERR